MEGKKEDDLNISEFFSWHQSEDHFDADPLHDPTFQTIQTLFRGKYRQMSINDNIME